MRMLRPATLLLRNAFCNTSSPRANVDVASALAAALPDSGPGARVAADLRKVYRFKDVTQLSVLCREMRKWDEDGVPDPAAVQYGEFVLKVTVLLTARLAVAPQGDYYYYYY
eukprot:GHUV01052382.1.p1 GENE.GHUV01052382.1~~GHUV01052382.1.p1  ORF type:complete len:112 (+),score=28.73 GHUV01052382.1:142-477(+)